MRGDDARRRQRSSVHPAHGRGRRLSATSRSRGTVWIGATKGPRKSPCCTSGLKRRWRELGFRREHRRFRPHLTIGRVRNADRGIEELAQVLAENHEFVAGVVDVDEVVAFSSELDRAGPIHEPLATAPLEGG